MAPNKYLKYRFPVLCEHLQQLRNIRKAVVSCEGSVPLIRIAPTATAIVLRDEETVLGAFVPTLRTWHEIDVTLNSLWFSHYKHIPEVRYRMQLWVVDTLIASIYEHMENQLS